MFRASTLPVVAHTSSGQWLTVCQIGQFFVIVSHQGWKTCFPVQKLRTEGLRLPFRRKVARVDTQPLGAPERDWLSLAGTLEHLCCNVAHRFQELRPTLTVCRVLLLNEAARQPKPLALVSFIDAKPPTGRSGVLESSKRVSSAYVTLPVWNSRESILHVIEIKPNSGHLPHSSSYAQSVLRQESMFLLRIDLVSIQ